MVEKKPRMMHAVCEQEEKEVGQQERRQTQQVAVLPRDDEIENYIWF